MGAPKHSRQRAHRSAPAAGTNSSKAKEAKAEPLTVGRMLKNVKEKLAGLRNNKPAHTQNATVASVVDLAKKREARKAQKKPVKAPTLKETMKKKASAEAAGFAERAENANVRALTKQTGRKGSIAQPPRDDLGGRNR